MSYMLAATRRKIKNTEDLRSVVRLMKALATAGLVQLKEAVAAVEDYCRTVEYALSLCLRSMDQHEFMTANRTSGVPGLILFGSDQGMVGQFNEHLIDEFRRRHGGGEARLWIVGERLNLRAEEAGLKVRRSFSAPQSIEGISPLISDLLLEVEEAHLSGAAGEIHYCRHAPVLQGGYVVQWDRLLPLDKDWSDRFTSLDWPSAVLPEMVDGGGTLGELIREYLFVSLYRACAESCTAEQLARLSAMKRAEHNIEDRRQELELEYHHGRHEAIDAELFDLVATFEAQGRG